MFSHLPPEKRISSPFLPMRAASEHKRELDYRFTQVRDAQMSALSFHTESVTTANGIYTIGWMDERMGGGDGVGCVDLHEDAMSASRESWWCVKMGVREESYVWKCQD